MTRPVYAGLDQAALDAEYDNQRHVPGFRTILSDYAERSAAARATLECRPGVPYGPAERQRLDLFPAMPGAPVHVFFHGGAWRALDRSDAAAQAPAMVNAGIAYVAAGFELATSVPLATMVAQARQAVGWVAANAASFGADVARITVSGHSSGAYLAAMVALTDWSGFGLAPDLVKGVALVSGLYDLEPVRLSYRNAMLQLDAAEALQLSPLHQRPRPAMRMLLGVAEHETAEFHRQTRALQRAWFTPAIIVAAGRNHYDVALDLADPGTAIGAAVVSLAITG